MNQYVEPHFLAGAGAVKKEAAPAAGAVAGPTLTFKEKNKPNLEQS